MYHGRFDAQRFKVTYLVLVHAKFGSSGDQRLELGQILGKGQALVEGNLGKPRLILKRTEQPDEGLAYGPGSHYMNHTFVLTHCCLLPSDKNADPVRSNLMRASVTVHPDSSGCYHVPPVPALLTSRSM